MKRTLECEAGLVYRTYCIDTSTFYSPNLVNFLPMCHQKWTTTTYPKPKTLPQPPPWEHVITSTYRRPCHRGAWAPTSPMFLFSRFSRVTVLFTLRAAAMTCGSALQPVWSSQQASNLVPQAPCPVQDGFIWTRSLPPQIPCTTSKSLPNSSQHHPFDLSLQTGLVSWGELSAASSGAPLRPRLRGFRHSGRPAPSFRAERPRLGQWPVRGGEAVNISGG